MKKWRKGLAAALSTGLLAMALTGNALAAEEVRMYLLKPDDSGGLDVQQRALVMDQLLECVEVNFRTICDLIRYRHFKAAGLVSSVEEFLVLIHPDEAADSKEEKAT